MRRNSLRDKFINFMRGRYGQDQYGTFLYRTALILLIAAMLTRNLYFDIAAIVIWSYMLYRTLSRNFVKRSIENQKFMDRTKGFRRTMKVMKNNRTDKAYKYYLCPHCKRIVRIPRGHGKITITCPDCHTQFDRKS